MFNYSTQRHITHVLLVDTESAAWMRSLVANAADLYRQFCEIAALSRYSSYTLLLVFPQTRNDLAAPASELASEMHQIGVACKVNAIADADMFLVKGKAGLIACSLWSIAGALLVNDAPIALRNAELVLSLANRHEGVHFVDDGHAAVIADARSINTSVLRLPEGHSIGDLLKCIMEGPKPLGSAQKRKWWQPKG